MEPNVRGKANVLIAVLAVSALIIGAVFLENAIQRAAKDAYRSISKGNVFFLTAITQNADHENIPLFEGPEGWRVNLWRYYIDRNTNESSQFPDASVTPVLFVVSSARLLGWNRLSTEPAPGRTYFHAVATGEQNSSANENFLIVHIPGAEVEWTDDNILSIDELMLLLKDCDDLSSVISAFDGKSRRYSELLDKLGVSATPPK